MSVKENFISNRTSFLTLKVGFVPDWFLISPDHNSIYIYPMIYLIPTWGIRRNFAKNFNYEFKLGLGIKHYLNYYNIFNRKTGAIPNISFKIGYDF